MSAQRTRERYTVPWKGKQSLSPSLTPLSCGLEAEERRSKEMTRAKYARLLRGPPKETGSPTSEGGTGPT